MQESKIIKTQRCHRQLTIRSGDGLGEVTVKAVSTTLFLLQTIIQDFENNLILSLC